MKQMMFNPEVDVESFITELLLMETHFLLIRKENHALVNLN